MIRNMGSSRDAIEPTVLLVGAGERFTPAFQAALPRIGSLREERREEWSERPDDVLMLTRI